MKRSILMTTAAALAMTAFTGSVFAQDTESNAQDSSSGDVILVTARRREEGLVDAPIAVSAFGASDLEQLGIQTVDDVARFTPGLSFSAAFGRSTERPVIRGQSNVLAGVQFGVESGTAYFVDGIYYPSTIQNLDPNELQRVEVIRGPQSALYGRNTYAGAINFITRDPSAEFTATGRFRVGNHGEHEEALSISGPLSDTVGFRLNIRNYNYDGEHQNILTGRDVGSESTQSVSGLLQWDPSDNLRVRFRGSWSEDDDGSLPIFLQSSEMNNCMPGFRSNSAWTLSGSTNDNQYYCGVIRPGQIALNTDALTSPIDPIPGVPPTGIYNNFNGLPFLPPFDGPYSLRDGTAFDGIYREQFLFSALSDWDIGGTGYVLTTALGLRQEEEWQGFDSDHSAVNLFHPFLGDEAFFANTGRDDVQDISFDLRIASPTDQSYRWLLGAYYYRQEVDGFDITFANPRGVASDQSSTRNGAFYGLLEFDLTDRLTATFEGRYAEETKRVTDGTFNASASFDNFTPRVTLDYQLDDGATLYGVYAEGVKPGGLNGEIGRDIGRPTYAQETSRNFEIGYKREMFGGSGLLQVAAFYIDATDVQLTTPVASATGALNSVATNQGSAEITGIELQWNHAPTDNFTYGLSYAYTNPEFTEGCDDFQWTLTSGGGEIDPTQNTAPGGGTEFNGLTGNCSIAGNQLPLTSEHQASANFEFRQQVMQNGIEGFVRADLTYESSKFVQVHNLAETGDATLLGAQFGIEGDNWTLTAYGRNLLDEDSIVMATRWLQTPYFSFASPNNAPAGAATGSPRAFFGTLRRGPAYGAELRVRF